MNKLIIVLKIFLYLILFFTINDYCYSNIKYLRNDTIKYKDIAFKDYGIYPFTLEIQDSIMKFDGYILFAFSKYDTIPNHNEFELKINNCFFLKDLCDLKLENMILFNYPIAYSIYLQSDTSYLYQKPNEHEAYSKFKRLFNNYELYSRNSTITDKPFLWYSINSKIFDRIDLSFVSKNNNDSVGYFIFKCNFSAILLKYDYYEKYYGEYPKSSFFLLPTSKLTKFKPVSLSFLQKKGYNRSNWYPDGLFHY